MFSNHIRRSLLQKRVAPVRNLSSAFGQAAEQIPIMKICLISLPLSFVLAHAIVYGVYNHEETLAYLRTNVPNFDEGMSIYRNNLVRLGVMQPLLNQKEEENKPKEP